MQSETFETRTMSRAKGSEGLPLARLFMVLASISPLFLLWAIRGIPVVPDVVLIPVCIGMILVPNFVLFLRFKCAQKAEDIHTRIVYAAEDNRSHLLVYLFAMLLPLYATGLDSWRSLAAALVALAFIVFLFWHLNLYYMNIVFAALGYRIFSVLPPTDTSGISDLEGFVLITARHSVRERLELSAYRISNHVFWERKIKP